MTDLPAALARALPVLGEMSLTLLWLVVFARLLIPVSLESPLSIVPDALPQREPVQAESTAPPVLQTAPVQAPGPAQTQPAAQPDGANPVPVTQGSPALTMPEGVPSAVPPP